MAQGTPAAGTPPAFVNVLTVALCCGLLAGVLEPLSLVMRLSTAAEGHLALGVYLWWMPAAANLVWFAFLAVIGWGLARAFRGRLTLTALAGTFLAFAFVNSLRILDGHLGILTVDLIAIGLAVQLTRQVGDRLAGWLPRLRAAVFVGLVAVAATAAGIEGARTWSERRRLSQLPAARAGAPNILLLVLDTVRAMNLSAYGYARRTSPNLEALAARGTLFERAISAAPWTRPAHASLFTGQWEHDHTADHTAPLDRRHPTLAEELGRLGYRTGGFTANLTHTTASAGIARGFAHYEGHLVSFPQVMVASATTRAIYRALQKRLPIPETRVSYRRKSSVEVNRNLLAWLDASGDRPFFAFTNYMDAHASYDPRPPFDTAFSSPAYPDPLPPRGSGFGMDRVQRIRPYDQAIATVDHDIGQLLQDLDRRGLLENTIVVVTADHGEAFGEHGIYGHGSTLYPTMLQVPLIVVWPGHVPAGYRVPEWVSTRALATTLMDLASPDTPHPFPGPPLTRFWDSEAPEAETLFAGSGYAANNPEWYPTSKGHIRGIIEGRMLLIREADDRRELFDATADPWTMTDLLSLPGTDTVGSRLARALEAEVGPAVLHPSHRPPAQTGTASR